MSGSNLEKHTSKNPLVGLLNGKLVQSICDLSLSVNPKNILDAGCGEGFIIKEIVCQNNSLNICGIDIDDYAIEYAKKQNPGIEITKGSVYELPYENNSYELVILSEVLEHLEDPRKALFEIERVTSKYCLISVPHEPIFRAGNISRLKYLKRLGNTPGHLNNWTKNQFVTLLSEYFELEKVKTPLPWVVALCRKK